MSGAIAPSCLSADLLNMLSRPFSQLSRVVAHLPVKTEIRGSWPKRQEYILMTQAAMTQTVPVRLERFASGNLARVDLDNLDRFGVYTRLFYEGRGYTNLEELNHAGSLARLLKGYDVAPGDRVVVMMPNSPDVAALFPAIWRIGAAIVPVIPQWTAGEVADVLRNSGATVAL